jgi:molybdate transport system regulatory protein
VAQVDVSGQPRARLRLDLAPGVSLGPGKAELLRGIAETGSISAAGRRIGMSYKRAWQLVDCLNRDFAAPLVSASRGGAHGGGAALTPLGAEVLTLYQSLQAQAATVLHDGLMRLAEKLAPRPADPDRHRSDDLGAGKTRVVD